MENKNIKLILVALGSFMLVLLQTEMFQRVMDIFGFIGLSVIGDIIRLLSSILSFVGFVIFAFTSFKIIKNNIK
ncbi:hypothetical protein JJB75_09840 [Clostridium perfringens]|uniref:Uncharacterized protein n=1 Tax=Clostridium perfringens TaxID=1502 RepID=A0A133ND39_CLOPF|nr:hypothetical protein [Clostridium perfringens]EGT3600330.1 hypothetical protein [Clostridium perfringens]EGT4142312.1 hypothetical protein [Clostridium perfringens]EGT5619580.1 hypothetical protein [Clostridium perfringens]EHK2441528.1 hypothetical protein [Clostridium perfringens]KXA14183.1 hypothetical protein HMPREF3222_00463 [Clostridium perfringens]